jgi:hypothetical protein
MSACAGSSGKHAGGTDIDHQLDMTVSRSVVRRRDGRTDGKSIIGFSNQCEQNYSLD